jgi:hypothetical protein
MAKEKFNVKADKDNIPGYDSELEIEVDSTYEAYFKGSIPAPSQYTDDSGTITITWFNNFGIREKKSKKDTNVEYTVKLKKVPAGKRIFVKTINGNAIEVTSKKSNDPDNEKLKYSDAGGGKIIFSWDEGDPATGQAP